jgi:hypothetical protein
MSSIRTAIASLLSACEEIRRDLTCADRRRGDVGGSAYKRSFTMSMYSDDRVTDVRLFANWTTCKSIVIATSARASSTAHEARHRAATAPHLGVVERVVLSRHVAVELVQLHQHEAVVPDTPSTRHVIRYEPSTLP